MDELLYKALRSLGVRKSCANEFCRVTKPDWNRWHNIGHHYGEPTMWVTRVPVIMKSNAGWYLGAIFNDESEDGLLKYGPWQRYSNYYETSDNRELEDMLDAAVREVANENFFIEDLDYAMQHRGRFKDNVDLVAFSKRLNTDTLPNWWRK